MAKVYVSSTIADMEAERKAVFEWLRAARHQAVDSYLPDSETVSESCLKDIDCCDLYVLILGYRYGHQPKENNPERLSITHLEFRRAGASKIPRVALLSMSVPDVALSDLLDPDRAQLVKDFREEVEREVRPAQFKDLEGLVKGLSTGVQQELHKLNDSVPNRAERWLSTHLEDVARQFASHMAATSLRQGTQAKEAYLDLLVVPRQFGKKEQDQNDGAKDGRPIAEVIQEAQSPLIVIGEGGAGKTTSLLFLAASAADRAASDPAAPVPIYVNLGRLTRLSDLPDLLQFIADSVAGLDRWDQLVRLIRSRPMLFLFDSFNEIPEQLQRECAVVLSRFVDKHAGFHQCVIGSRLVAAVENLARPPSPFRTFEILRLTTDQVQSFLEGLGLGSLYSRMPQELRDLAGNPFMLVAIAQTLAGKPEATLPRNQGRLYREFAREWMVREKAKHREPKYSYDRVKEPILAYLAKRMTAAGRISVLDQDVEDEMVARLAVIHERFHRRGGIPEDWTVDDCLDEILGDGLLRRVNQQLYFMHQSVQEYFTAVFFSQADPDALIAFTPTLVWELVSRYSEFEIPKHRFVPPLLMMAGLHDDGTDMVKNLAERNPLLAAAAIAAANHVEPALLADLEQRWLDDLKHKDFRHRLVGCSCLALASIKSPRAIRDLVALALDVNFENAYSGRSALGRLGAPSAIAREIGDTARQFDENEFFRRESQIAEAIETVQGSEAVSELFQQWRAADPGSVSRRRLQRLLATMGSALVSAELQRIRSGADDPAVATDAEAALGQLPSWEPIRTGIPIASELRKIRENARREYQSRVARSLKNLKNASDRELLEILTGASDSAARAAAAAVTVERRLPGADQLIDSLLRYNDRDKEALLSAAVSLLGEKAVISRLIERSREKAWHLGSLAPEAIPESDVSGELPDPLKNAIRRFGAPDNLSVKGRQTDPDGSVTWVLAPDSWSGFRPRYEVRASPTTTELYDCNLAPRAFQIVSDLSGDASLGALQSAAEHEDPRVREIVRRSLVERTVASLAERGDVDRLLQELHSTQSEDFIREALDALGRLQNRKALSLVDDVLALRPGPDEWSEIHPVWGRGNWGDAIHGMLFRLNADEEIAQALDSVIASGDPDKQAAALLEFSRWLQKPNVRDERRPTWMSPIRIERLLNLAVFSPIESIRELSAKALAHLISPSVLAFLSQKLADGSAEVQLAAARVLVLLNVKELYGQLAALAANIIRTREHPDLRCRAGRILSAIEGSVDPFYTPVSEALTHNQLERALELVDDLIEVFPDDVVFAYYRGHALRGLGRLEEAAKSFAHACELNKGAPVIPRALAETYLEAGQFAQAMETARSAVEFAPYDAEAQATLAWSSYKASAFAEAENAGAKAVAFDPVHATAIWILVLAQLRQGDHVKARAAFLHAMRVRQVLSPGYDDSFVATFLRELSAIPEKTESTETVREIRNALVGQDSAKVNESVN
jgi:tetratricopeptide (TPR) repeat protein